jgi:type I restriction enzyme S subunit
MKRWPNKLLIEVAAVIRGISFDKSQVSNEPSENSIPILRAGNIQDSLLIDSDLVYVPQELVSEEQLMRRGDLAICMSSGSSSIVGKSAHLATDWRGSVGAFCAIVRFNAQIHHRFGSYWFRSPAFLRWRDSNAKGANIQNLRRAELEKLSVPVPPLAEQERIVKLLDEADELRKLRVQADRRTADLIPAFFHEMFGDVGLRCNSATIEDAVEQFIDYRGKTPAKSSSGVPLVTAKIVKRGRILLANEFIPEETYDTWMRRGLPKVGDVLFTMEAPLGEVAIVEHTRIALAQRILLMRPREALLDSQYFMAALKMPSVWKQIEEKATGSTVRGIRQANLRKVLIPIPPLPLQKEFAQRETEIRELETEQTASRSRLDDLFQSMLYRAFNGDL